MNAAILRRHRFLIAAIVIAQLCDLVTFLPAISRVGIGAESNPLARYLFTTMGMAGPIALKLTAIAVVILVLWRVAARFPRYSLPPTLLAVGIGLIGAWSNIAFGLLR